MTKTAEKPYRLGPHIPVCSYKGVLPPPGIEYLSGMIYRGFWKQLSVEIGLFFANNSFKASLKKYTTLN